MFWLSLRGSTRKCCRGGGILDISYNEVYVYYADKGAANATLVMLLVVSVGKGSSLSEGSEAAP